MYVAEDAGFFEEEGLNVQISTAGGDAQAFSALTSGSADFAQGDPAFVAIAGEQGWEGRVVVMAVDRVAIWGVAEDPGIEPFTDATGFNGYSVATYPNPNTSYVVQRQLVEQAGLTVGEDTQIVQVQFGTELAALANGQVDIAQTIEPNVTQFEQQGGRVVFSYPEAWGPLAFTGLMVSSETIESDPEMVQGVVNAYERALRLIQSDFDRAVEIASARLPDLEEQTIRTALERLVASGSIPASTRVNPESWNQSLQIRIDVGDLEAMPEEELFDNSFAERARQN